MGKYLNETSKSARYDHFESAIIDRIQNIADEYMSQNGTHRVEDNHGECQEYELTEEQLIDEADNHAIREFLDMIDTHIGNDQFYWLAEIIISENFDWTPSTKNPFAVRKKEDSQLTASMSPYGIMFNIK